MYISAIDDALKEIDFEILDEDRTKFYSYIYLHHYNIEYSYDNEMYKTPNYFKFLHKFIKDYL
jgi:hypothetical protein